MAQINSRLERIEKAVTLKTIQETEIVIQHYTDDKKFERDYLVHLAQMRLGLDDPNPDNEHIFVLGRTKTGETCNLPRHPYDLSIEEAEKILEENEDAG